MSTYRFIASKSRFNILDIVESLLHKILECYLFELLLFGWRRLLMMLVTVTQSLPVD